ncbi:MAG: hypothetical protein Q4E56_00695 [Pseudomonadota bacterium]|nr:hypothetical protein [Pseudomonadota bacterium]
MKRRIDNMLLGLLWLLAMTLGACFWFNTMFGFNILSSAHWQYLAYIQAIQTPVKPLFYISFVVIVFIMVVGLYLIMRPRLRKIRLPIMRISKNRDSSAPQQNVVPQNQPVLSTVVAQSPTPTAPVQNGPTADMRPARLNTISFATQTPQMTAPNGVQPDTPVAVAATNADIQQVFIDAGYTVKKPARIGGIKTPLLAIGTNEALWLGANGARVSDMRAAIDKMTSIFADTLEDIVINVTGFVLDARDDATSEHADILVFHSIDELRQYVAVRQNTAPTNIDDAENFNAYSEYIDTVIDYIGKI